MFPIPSPRPSILNFGHLKKIKLKIYTAKAYNKTTEKLY